ncbi:MAG: hypothetical protein GX096_09370 [Clostridiales bacterium]|nr:hypothetical protein [Clostridiales bacterium]
MNKKKAYMEAASITAYICSVAWIIYAARCFSLHTSSPFLFLIIGAISLYSGLLVSVLRESITQVPLAKEQKSKYMIYTALSIVAPPAFILNLIACFGKQTDTVEVIVRKLDVKSKKKMSLKRKSTIIMVVGLCISLLASFVAMVFDTSGFSVDVSSFMLTKAMTEEYNTTPINGKTFIIANEELRYGVNMYLPNTATAQNPAATVFVVPGFTRTKETMAQYCIELSRRGMVVFCIDPGCQGDTTYPGFEKDENGDLIYAEDGKKKPLGSTLEANGLNYLVQYIYNNTEEYGFVDRERIGAIGHSAGGNNVSAAASTLAGDSYDESIIKALFISGYIKLTAAKKFTTLHSNSVLSYAYFDEGAYRYQTDTTSFEVVAKRFINEVNGEELDRGDAITNYPYGNMADGTYRIVEQDPVNHCFEMYSSHAIGKSLGFFLEALDVDTTLTDHEQIWWGKEICNGIAMIGGFIFVIALSALLVGTTFFSSIKGAPVLEEELVSRKKANKKASHKITFWTTMLITAVIACLDYIPLGELSMRLFTNAASSYYSFVFPARMINAVMLWALVNGLIGLAIYFGVFWVKYLWKKNHSTSKETQEELADELVTLRPMKIGIIDLLKTLLLAVILFLAFYGLVQVCSLLFHQDFRFTLISAGTLKARFIATWFMYIPVFFVFYISNSIRVNCSIGFEGWSEWKVNLVSGLANSVGLIFILVINYIAYFETGTVYYSTYGPTSRDMWLYINMIFGLIPMMFALPILNRLYYKQTNRVWLGAFINCMIFIMMSLSASVSYISM